MGHFPKITSKNLAIWFIILFHYEKRYSPTREETMENLDQLKEKIIAHVKKMKVQVDPTHAKCVDGGYRGDEAVGAMAIAGGHLGLSMALLRLGLSPDDAFNLVHKFVSQDGNPYCWHTDTHEGHLGVVVGCGHCNAAIGNSEKYGLEGQKVQELLEIVRKAQDDLENMECVTLNRKHAEQAILVITSSDYTVKPWDQENDIQYFIYDLTRHSEFINKFVDYLADQKITLNNKPITFDALFDASQAQTNVTLGLLDSSKGKPMFKVNVSGKEPEVEFLQLAPVIE